MLLFFDLPFDNFHLTRFLPDDEQGKINKKKLDSSQFDRSTTTQSLLLLLGTKLSAFMFIFLTNYTSLCKERREEGAPLKWRIVSEMEQFCRAKLSRTFLNSICGIRKTIRSKSNDTESPGEQENVLRSYASAHYGRLECITAPRDQYFSIYHGTPPNHPIIQVASKQ